MIYTASKDLLVQRAEAFRGMVGFGVDEDVFVVLPNRTSEIKVPTAEEADAYWNKGPVAFASNERFEEVRDYMRHYFRDADSAEGRWKQNAKVEAEIDAALNEMKRRE